MTIRKVAIRGSAHPGSEGDRPQGRARLFLLLTLGAGVSSWIAALIGNGLLLDFQTIIIDVHSNFAPQVIEAKALFPPVQPVHKTVTVYDPPAVAAPTRPTPKPTHTAAPSPSPSPSRSPRPTPSPDD